MSVEHPFEVTPRCEDCQRCGAGWVQIAEYGCPLGGRSIWCIEHLVEQGTRRVTDGPGTPRDSREQPRIQADTGEDAQTNLHS